MCLSDNLEEDCKYEAKVEARNEFGWSNTSDIFQFYIRSKGLYSMVEEKKPKCALPAQASFSINSTVPFRIGNRLHLLETGLLRNCVHWSSEIHQHPRVPQFSFAGI